MLDIVSSVFPVFLVVACAYAIGRIVVLDIKTLSALNLYVLLPALVYKSISETDIDWPAFGRIAFGCVLMLVVMVIILTLISRARKIPREEQGAFLMSLFPNLGNFGLPVAMFALGEKGFAFAIVVMVCGSFLQNSVGLYFAQRAHLGMAQAARRVFAFPMIYAFILALAAQRLSYTPPLPFDRAIALIAGATIPIQLMILGLQLAATRLDVGANVFIAATVRLIGGPVLAAFMVLLIGLEEAAAKAFILQMSGPVAVGMAAYGVQFNTAPRFLASIVAWTFLLSLITVSGVLFFLQHVSL